MNVFENRVVITRMFTLLHKWSGGTVDYIDSSCLFKSCCCTLCCSFSKCRAKSDCSDGHDTLVSKASSANACDCAALPHF